MRLDGLKINDEQKVIAIFWEKVITVFWGVKALGSGLSRR